MSRFASVALATCVIGCGAAAPVEERPTELGPPAPSAAATATTDPPSPSANATAAPAPVTRYRVGDYVVYAYDGSALPAPVTLTEEIVAQQALRLEIQVTARRGTEERRWIQVVTDTPENRHNDVIDELYLVEEGRR